LIAVLVMREHECTQGLANPSLAEHCHSVRPFAIHIPASEEQRNGKERSGHEEAV